MWNAAHDKPHLGPVTRSVGSTLRPSIQRLLHGQPEQVNQQITHTLYDESRQPLAELDQEGRITRQTVWLADIPLAVIDSPAGQALAVVTAGLAQPRIDLGRMVQSWLNTDAGIAWLHTMDFVFHPTAEGRGIRNPTGDDQATHEAVAIVAARAMRGTIPDQTEDPTGAWVVR